MKKNKTDFRPRLSVYRSNRYLSAQVIDDTVGRTLVSASSRGMKKMPRQEVAMAVGELLAEKALKARIKKVVFDRRHYLYHGLVKALAEGARKGGLVF
jgi:large subunit ribosomal protein L18